MIAERHDLADVETGTGPGEAKELFILFGDTPDSLMRFSGVNPRRAESSRGVGSLTQKRHPVSVSTRWLVIRA